jgi:hypothetical protein
MTAKFLVRGLIALTAFFISINSDAQIINMYHPNAAPQLGYSRVISNNASVAFSAYPASGSGPCTMTFTINNSSVMNLKPLL